MAKISRLETSLTAAHTGLVLFDTLNGYLHPRNPEKAAFLDKHQILSRMTKLLDGARRVGMTVFYPVAAHAADGSDTVARITDTDMDLNPLNGAKPIRPGIYKDSWEAQIADELAPRAGDVVVPKHRWSSFFQTDLEFHLRVRGIETIVLAGGSTDVGIASTAFAARDLDLGLVIVRDACYSMRGNNHDFFMDRVFPRMGRVMSVDAAVALMTA
jgi:ureidoacrylate peracid hydrolase